MHPNMIVVSMAHKPGRKHPKTKMVVAEKLEGPKNYQRIAAKPFRYLIDSVTKTLKEHKRLLNLPIFLQPLSKVICP
jgi:hypothetical protein